MPTTGSPLPSKTQYKLAVGGGLVFWATSIATSLLPIAAEYRASFSDRSWSIQTVWAGSLLGGMLIGFCVSYVLRLFHNRMPTGNPILQSVMLGFAALIISTILIDVPRSLHGPGNTLYYFFIGIVLNVPRFLFLGAMIGYLFKRLYRQEGASAYSMAGGDET